MFFQIQSFAQQALVDTCPDNCCQTFRGTEQMEGIRDALNLLT